MKTKVLVFSPSKLSGSPSYVEWISLLAKYLRENYSDKMDLKIVTLDEPWIEKKFSEKELKKRMHGFPLLELRCINLFGTGVLHPIELKKMRKLIKEADVFYFFYTPINEIIVSAISSGTPTIVGFHGEYLNPESGTEGIFDLPIRGIMASLLQPVLQIYRRIGNLFLKIWSPAVHCINKGMKDFFSKKGLKVHYIAHCIDISSYRGQDIGFRKIKPFTVAYLGRLEYLKGIPILLKSIEYVNEKYPELSREIQFKIAGAGTMKNEVVSFCSRYRNVEYLGFVPSPRELYLNSSLFVSPSYREPFGYVLLDAQFFGLPVVATNTSGAKETVNTKYGSIIHIGDFSGMGEEVVKGYKRFRDSPIEYKSELREYVKENFPYTKIMKKIVKMLEVESK